MLLTHAIAVAEARSYIAALDDHATRTPGSIAYDRALIYLDAAYGDHVPALATVPVHNSDLLYRLARRAVAELGAYGLDPLHVELTLAYLADAWALDHRPEAPGGRFLPARPDPGEPT